MKEYIGKVCLDDTYYPGEDLYSDGAVEDEMLKLSMEVEEEEFNREIDRRKAGPFSTIFLTSGKILPTGCR